MQVRTSFFYFLLMIQRMTVWHAFGDCTFLNAIEYKYCY